MQTSALFGAKNSGFFRIYGVSVRIRGVDPVRAWHFADRVGEVNFSGFCADVLYGWALTLNF